MSQWNTAFSESRYKISFNLAHVETYAAVATLTFLPDKVITSMYFHDAQASWSLGNRCETSMPGLLVKSLNSFAVSISMAWVLFSFCAHLQNVDFTKVPVADSLQYSPCLPHPLRLSYIPQCDFPDTTQPAAEQDNRMLPVFNFRNIFLYFVMRPPSVSCSIIYSQNSNTNFELLLHGNAGWYNVLGSNILHLIIPSSSKQFKGQFGSTFTRGWPKENLKYLQRYK